MLDRRFYDDYLEGAMSSIYNLIAMLSSLVVIGWASLGPHIPTVICFFAGYLSAYMAVKIIASRRKRDE